ncbi:MAG TPA: response regulator, partial [Polyangiaceae bacterium]
MVGAPRDEETAHLTGARADFVSGLNRRVDALRQGLRGVEQSPDDATQRNGLLRRLHALGSASRVLGFASVAEALTEAEKKLRRSEFADVARSLDLLPSLVLGVPMSPRPPTVEPAERGMPTSWPLSVLVFGTQSLVDALTANDGPSVECERTEELQRARELAQHFGPDLVLIDADKPAAREFLELLSKDDSIGPLPIVVIGAFDHPDAASSFIRLGATRVLPKPVSPDTLQRTVIELKSRRSEARVGQEPLGELSVEALTERIAAEVRRGLLDAVDSGGRGARVSF